MQVSFAIPDPRLARMVSIYYLFEDDHSLIEDMQRADIAHLRFIMDGEGYQDFGSHRVPSCPLFLTGPGTAANSFTLRGPLRFVGVPLLPEAWGGLVDADASRFADSATDGAAFLGDQLDALMATIKGCNGMAEMAPHIDAFLLRHLRRVPEGDRQVIETIRAWLAASDYPAVPDLYARCQLSERQVARIANRYYGSPPKALARKYAALRTASHILTHDGAFPDGAMDHYSDQSHLIREVKRVTGQTPRQLRTIATAIMRMTLSPDNFRELEPRS